MYTANVQYSAQPEAVKKLVHPDGDAEYRLVSDIRRELDAENNPIICADEVYFEIPSGKYQPSEAEIEADFAHWWKAGFDWFRVMPKKQTPEERLDELEAALIELAGIIAEEG